VSSCCKCISCECEYVWSFYKSISSGAQHATVQKYLLFSDPGTADRWETTNSKPPVPINLSSQSDVRPCGGFYQPQQTVQKCWVKTILLSQIGTCDFSSSNFNSQGHILSTGGVALMNRHLYLSAWTSLHFQDTHYTPEEG
jgi:hypothetical protein